MLYGSLLGSAWVVFWPIFARYAYWTPREKVLHHWKKGHGNCSSSTLWWKKPTVQTQHVVCDHPAAVIEHSEDERCVRLCPADRTSQMIETLRRQWHYTGYEISGHRFSFSMRVCAHRSLLVSCFVSLKHPLSTRFWCTRTNIYRLS